MDRNEFLSLLGLTASSMVFGCFTGCSKGQGSSAPAPVNVDFTLDLTQAGNIPLQTNGGYIYSNGIIIARTLSGQFIALSQTCTHQNFSVNYVPQSHLFYCGGHGATYSENGQVTGGPAPASLTSYHTTLSGNSLRVYS